MVFLHVLLVSGLVHLSQGQSTDCHRRFKGYCRGLFGASCQPGELQSFDHCGFLSFCCYPNPTNVHSIDKPSVPKNDKMSYHGEELCGGTLIDEQWVLTASHCFEETYITGWTMVLGTTDISNIKASNVYTVSKILTHSDYNNVTLSYDIAMVKLSKPVDFSVSNIKPACLPRKEMDFDNQVCTISGWGTETFETDQYPDKMEETNVPVISNDMCKYYLGNIIYDHNICAGLTQGGRDTCQGDSGGPLVCKTDGRWTIAGIISWGYGCGDKATPGVYTRVTSFLDWIEGVRTKY